MSHAAVSHATRWADRPDRLATLAVFFANGVGKIESEEKFHWRLLQEDVVTLTAEQLNWLLDGYDVWSAPHRMIRFTHVSWDFCLESSSTASVSCHRSREIGAS